MNAFILHPVLGLRALGRRGHAAALLLVLTGLLAACGGGGGGGGAAPMVTLTSIAITPASPSIALGTTTQLTATGSYSDGTKKDISSQVTWDSATKTVATVSTAGLATSVAVGTSAITGVLSGVTGNDTLTVTAATVVSIAITPATPTIAPGSKPLQFTATGTYTDKTTKDLTTSVHWTSTNSAVAAIGPTTGLASAVGVGTTMIGGTYTGGPAITAVTLTVNGTVYAYASNFDDGTVSQYVISTGGALSALNPTTVAAGASPFSVSVELTGQYVYVANYNANTVSQYAIGAGGVLTAVGTGAVMTGSHPNGVTIDPANKHAYVANFGGDTVSQYNIDTTGALTLMSTSTVPTGSFPASIVISPNGKYAYVANFACAGPGCAAAQGTISQYTVGADGALTAMTPATVNTGSTTSRPNSLIVDPTSAYLYVANAGDGTVSQFNIGASGTLTLAGTPLAAGTFPFSVTVDPLGRYVYVANTGSASAPAVQGTISQYSITAGTGALAPIGTGSVPAGLGVSSVTVDPTGTYAYATNRGESSLSQYMIGVNGGLTPLPTPTATAGLHPTSIATGY